MFSLARLAVTSQYLADLSKPKRALPCLRVLRPADPSGRPAGQFQLTPRCGRRRWGRTTPPWCPWCSRNLSCKLQGARWTLDRESAMISQVTDWQPRPNHTSISYGEVNMQQSGTGRAQIYRWKERETIRSRQCWRWQRADQDQDILHWSPLDVEPSGQMRLCKFLIIKATS